MLAKKDPSIGLDCCQKLPDGGVCGHLMPAEQFVAFLRVSAAICVDVRVFSGVTLFFLHVRFRTIGLHERH
jgi:hypothetical protein